MKSSTKDKKIIKIITLCAVIIASYSVSSNFIYRNINAYAETYVEGSQKDYYHNKFEAIDNEISELNNKYNTEDLSEVNEMEKEKLKKWDDALNDIYNDIKNQIPEEEKNKLEKEELNWISDKDNEANNERMLADDEMTASVKYNSKLATLTRERCYYLLNNYMNVKLNNEVTQEKERDITQEVKSDENSEKSKENDQKDVIDYDKINQNKIKFDSENKKIEKFIDELNSGKYDTVSLEKNSFLGAFSPRFKQTIDKTQFSYRGKMKNNRPHGMGFMINKEDNSYYIGDFKKGQFNGYGILVYESNNQIKVYEGYFEKNKFCGKGNESYDKEGNFLKLFSDKGKDITISDIFYFNTVLERNGNFKNNKLNGKGTVYYLDGTIYEQGKFKKGELSGKGKSYYQDGTLEYEGSYKKGTYNGKGTLYNKDGSVKYKGKWKNGDVA